MEIKIKYLNDECKRIKKIDKGDWIDLYTSEDTILYKGDSAFINLGVAMQLPKGYEAHLVVRSSTFKKYGIIQVNSVGIIDESYCGDENWWLIHVLCMDPKIKFLFHRKFTFIPKGTRIAQFRIINKMPNIDFIETEKLNNVSRGCFGSTGTE